MRIYHPLSLIDEARHDGSPPFERPFEGEDTKQRVFGDSNNVAHACYACIAYDAITQGAVSGAKPRVRNSSKINESSLIDLDQLGATIVTRPLATIARFLAF